MEFLNERGLKPRSVSLTKVQTRGEGEFNREGVINIDIHQNIIKLKFENSFFFLCILSNDYTKSKLEVLHLIK